MKIALVDNMNNNYFAFARYLKDLNIDVHLYTIPNHHLKHFEPNADTFNPIENMKWIHYFPVEVNNINWVLFNKKCIEKEFIHYDLIISCGLSSAYLQRVGIMSDIIIPYGSDLYDIPFRKIHFSLDILDFLRSILWNNQAKHQKIAYEKSKVLVTDDAYYLYGNAINKLKLISSNIGIPMLYNKEVLTDSSNQALWSYLDDYDFIVFNHARQYWLSDVDQLDDFDLYGGLKRNDKLIRAFAKFSQNTTFKHPILILFEYGPDVVGTKNIIQELQIEHLVKWMPTLERKYIMYGLEKAHFSTNAFRENTTDIGGVCYESLAAGTPHLNNCIEALKNPNHKFYLSPMIHVLSQNDILDVFIDYEKTPQKYLEIGLESKEWFDKNLGLGLAKKYVKLMKILIEDENLTQNTIQTRAIFEN